ncbi:hypothetical protein [Paenibacillus abyssi]|uniref:Uncharacterized protein n=1 Tax=Paenibacillus abyssi TaxID=1340531 RepID=A0A917G7D1_9BACL|nr:hypothetical protein [Paenibacillus abyssi]GGG26527.1 hypothetical protein GCM10010916_48650 [Paenibacillus abyssi]
MKKTGKSRHLLYLILALAMLIVAVTRFELEPGRTLSMVFGVVWMLFALLVIAANLHALIGVDEDTRKELDRVRRAKKLMWQRKLQQRENRSRSAKQS